MSALPLFAAALIGVNYYPPFSADYRQLGEHGYDHKAVMRDDVAHFRRLGIGYVRLHVFDREVSRPDGSLDDNRHLEFLDYLIDLCASNGLKTVLTPIAWFGNPKVWGTDGFSDHLDITQLTGDRATWPIQARYIGEFLAHTNRYNGVTYAREPSILAFEAINEPQYPAGMASADITAYIDMLVAAFRAAGTEKPVYYNTWLGKNAALNASTADGATGCYYPTGLVAGHALKGPQLDRVQESTLTQTVRLSPEKKRMIYEFEAADTPGSYMYPAMAKLFRSEGVELAAMFQYDPLPIADRNETWNTHYLNLVYTPAKALSLAIAAEVFRHVPIGCAFAHASQEMRFSPFALDAAKDVSQMVTETDYLYTNDTLDPPPTPTKLRRVWGHGRSSVVASDGSGAYFLDRAADGVWRLQLYPNIFCCEDPYLNDTTLLKTVVVAGSANLTVNLPNLGSSYRAKALAGGGTLVAKDGSLAFEPGDYVLWRDGVNETAAISLGRTLDVPQYVAPKPVASTPWVKTEALPTQWNSRTGLEATVSSIFADTCAFRFENVKELGVVRTATLQEGANVLPAGLPGVGEWKVFTTAEGPDGTYSRQTGKIRFRDSLDDWNLFDVELPLDRLVRDTRLAWRFRSTDDRGEPAWNLHALNLVESAGAIINVACDGPLGAKLFPEAGPGMTLVVHARAALACTTGFELVLWQSDRRPWSVKVPVSEKWADVRIPLSSMRYLAGWDGAPPYEAGRQPDRRLVQNVRIMLAREYVPESAWPEMHAVEVSSVTIE